MLDIKQICSPVYISAAIFFSLLFSGLSREQYLNDPYKYEVSCNVAPEAALTGLPFFIYFYWLVKYVLYFLFYEAKVFSRFKFWWKKSRFESPRGESLQLPFFVKNQKICFFQKLYRYPKKRSANDFW